ncbi:MAG: GNAT family N-acetyltransferase [Oscillospiraceae bacterium]|nr:GNAT family N-acetyltransferase [Oscillospiraceae bacterium]
MDFYVELKKLLAREYNCSTSDFDGTANVVTVSTGNRGRRYSEDGAFFSMATLGANCVITADERMQPFLREFVKRGEQGHWLFEAEKLVDLERELNRFGYGLHRPGPHHMYLPRYDVDLPMKFPIKLLAGLDSFKRFYGDPRFKNALCGEYSPERPDVIALIAMDGDEIMGMAGASRDYTSDVEGAPSWLQIGVDVLPEYRGRGVGTFLVNELKNIVLKSGDIPFYGTAPANLHSQNIALNCGFRPAWVEISSEKKDRKITEDKEQNTADKPELPKPDETSDTKTWVDDMKQELEDYIEEQGIYIRQ